MESRHKDALLRIYQADKAWSAAGNEPETFVLVYTGDGADIIHPRWDQSWAVPSEHTIDDLEELGLLRVEPSSNKSRKFTLTIRGREEAAAATQQLAGPRATGGQAPQQDEVLRWLVETSAAAPEAFDVPSRLLDHAVDGQLIEAAGRETLARRILSLIEQGYLSGKPPGLEQTTAETELSMTDGLELTMLGHGAAAESGGDRTLNIYGSIVNSQVASGDITNYTTFTQVIEHAYEALEALEGVDDTTKAEARGIFDQLRDGAGEAVEATATGAAGALVASIISHLIGLPVN
jgi:hypothetical protein